MKITRITNKPRMHETMPVRVNWNTELHLSRLRADV